MKTSLAIIVNKLVTFGCKLFGKNGTQLPGSIVLDYIDDNILDKVNLPKIVIAVTGSSGKGTTCNLIKHILEDAGYSVALNETGSNGVVGATTLILNNLSINNKFKKDCLLLECDEQHLKLIFKKQKPTHLVITNITRDQPVRNKDLENIYSQIKQAINEDVHLIINGDDPQLNRLTYEFSNVTTYGIDKTFDSTTSPYLNNVDFGYCPMCGKKLKYTYYHYGHLGKYVCPNGDFKRHIDYLAKDVNLENYSFKIDKDTINLNKDALYTVYATLAAYTTSMVINIPKEKILYALNKDKVISKRGKIYKLDNRDFTMLETKNENNLSYFQSCQYIKKAKGKKTVILGFENVSRRYKQSDLSWLYDVNFELLNDKSIDKIFLIGRFRYDCLLRLEYAGIKRSKLILIDNLDGLLNEVVDKSEGNIYTMVCFDMTANILKLIKDDENENN